MLFRWTIRKKLASVFFFLAAFSILIVGFRAYQISRNALEQRIGKSLERQAKAMIEQIDRMLFERYRNIQTWASNGVMTESLTEDSRGRISEFLTKMKEEYGFYSDLVYADTMGNVIAASRPQLIGANVFDMPWFRNALESSGVKTQDVHDSPLVTGYTVAFATAIRASVLLQKAVSGPDGVKVSPTVIGEFGEGNLKTLGVLAGFLYWPEVIDLINNMPILDEAEQSKSAYAMLIGSNGLALTQSYFDTEAVILHENLVQRNIQAANSAAQGKSGYILEKGRFGAQDLIGYAAGKGFKDFKGFGWSVLVFESRNKAMAPIRALKAQICSLGFLIAFLAALVSMFFARGIATPLVNLARLAHDISKGDFSGKMEVKSRDEIGLLTASFNHMTSTLEKAKGDLIKSKDFIDNIIKSTTDMMLVIDDKGLIKTCNPAASHLLGYEPEEMEGKSVDLFFEEEELKNIEKMGAVKKGEAVNIETHYKTKEGKLIPVLISATRMIDQAGNFQGIVVLAKDISEYKRLEQQFRTAQKMEAIGNLAGGVAHDFNNMLSVVNLSGEKMRRQLGADHALHKQVDNILSAAQRATALVRQLLAFSRRQIIQPGLLNLNELVEGMDKMLPLLVGENVEIEFKLSGSDLGAMRADPGQLEQVLANLVVNARDAMPKDRKGKLVIETARVNIDEAYASLNPGMRTGDFVMLAVTDNGSGMDEETKKRIFEPFFTTKEKGKGTGLGLATCYGIAKQAGGYIEVQSKIGEGTTFKVYFPHVEGNSETLTKPGEVQELPRGSEVILLVEHEDLVRESAAGLLREQGYKILDVASSREALELMQKDGHAVSLVLTEVNMPEINGKELADRILLRRPSLKILYTSGHTDDTIVHSSELDPGVAFLQKPYSREVLARKVREVLDIIPPQKMAQAV